MRRGVQGAAALIALCVLALTVDWGIARYKAPSDDARILALQNEVAEDASKAPVLEAEHKRITVARAARKARGNILAWVLIAACAVFITLVKQLVPAPAVARPRVAKAASGAVLPACGRNHEAAEEDSAERIAAVDAIIARAGRGRESAIPILQAIQARFHYLPDAAMKRVAETTEITPAELAGASTFYHQFRQKKAGEHVVRVCHGTACHVAGARQITEELRRALELRDGEDTDKDGLFTVDSVACIGCCSLAPVMTVDEHTVGTLTPSTARAAVECIHPKVEA